MTCGKYPMFYNRGMKIKFITVGLPQLSFAKEGIKEYTKRISRFADIDVVHVKERKNIDIKIQDAIGNYLCILLDEKGKEYSSQELALYIEKLNNQSLNIAVIIGGPHGHSDFVRSLPSRTFSLSRLTFPHDIAMMITLETLYRSLTILAGHPYHKE